MRVLVLLFAACLAPALGARPAQSIRITMPPSDQAPRKAASPTKPPPAPPVLARPSAKFELIFLQYRRGDADAAVETLSQWTEGDALSEAVPSPNDDPWTRAALVSLLTEAGIRRGTFGYFSQFTSGGFVLTGWGLDKHFELFSQRSYAIVKDLTRMAKSHHDEALINFCSHWYAMATSYTFRFGRPAYTGLREMADHDLGDNAEIRLLVGSIMENRVGPYVKTATSGCLAGMIEGHDGCAWQKASALGPHPTPTQEALYLLSHAVAKDPTLIEAHLRLGHVFHLINQNVDAKPHLERAFHDAKAQHLNYMVYMSALYLGDIAEHENQLTEAVAYFKEAVAVDATAHIANVALGEALLRSGQNTGWTDARHLFDGEDPEHPRALDGWFYYRWAQFWRLAPGLREMRATVRGMP